MENNAIQKQPGTVATPASSTAVKATAPRTQPASKEDGPVERRPRSAGRTFLEAIASLKLTVVLFVLSLILVFYGTVAQMENGVWTVVERYFRSWVVFIPIQLNVQVLQVFFGVPAWVKIPGAIPFPAGWTIGGLLLVNLLAAHAIRFKLTWARGGILLLHAGMILLLLGELATGLFSQEGNMTLRNGESANYVVDNRKVELAIVTPLEGDVDDVVVVPGSLLTKPGQTISHNDLPFDVVVNKWMKNSGITNDVSDANPATAGFGLRERAVERPEVSGTDPEQKADAPSAYVTLKDKKSGEEMGTYLVSTLYFDSHFRPQTQKVEADGKTYDIALRFKQVQKPYTVTLHKFNHDLFPGTNKAKNFSSEVQLIYPERGEDRRVEISMNNPLRLIVNWDGVVPQVDTLFQSSFLPGNEGTILHVVDNRSWLMPYIACTMVTLGMLWHFGLMLPMMLMRVRMASQSAAAKKADILVKTPTQRWLEWAPVAAVVLTVLYFGYTALPPRDKSEGLQVQAFGRLPVQEGGRVQPLDSLARNTLMMLSDRQEFYEEKLEPGEAPKLEADKEWVKRSAIVWLLDVMSSSVHWKERPYFQVPADLAGVIQLPPKQEGKFADLYSYNDIDEAKGSARLLAIFNNARKKDFTQLQAIEKQAIHLVLDRHQYETLGRFLTTHRVFRIENLEVQALLGLPRREGHRFSIAEFADRFDDLRVAAKEAFAAEEKDKHRVTAYQHQVMKTWKKVNLYLSAADYSRQLLIPPLSEPGQEHWYNFETRPSETLEVEAGGHIAAAIHGYFYAKNPATEVQGVKIFNDNVAKYQEELAEHPVPAAKAIGLEQHFNKMAPFYQCLSFYGIVMVLVLVSWLFLLGGEGSAPDVSTALQRSAFWIMAVTAIVHTVALCVRMYLQGRPPVTNLYSSAIFIGWGCVLLGLFLDVVYRTSLGTLVGAVLGFMTSIIAFHLASTGDTLEMMQAVLDTNLWLATHVTTVTLGYMATFVAGGMGIVYLILWLFGEINGKQQLRDVQKTLSTMIYGVVCFAMLLSFVGTVLGGIWADQSWGRFWGWDPKENGAVLIVIWNALILHARWAGMVKSMGVAALAVVGNMITVWSWFGTNQLGVGLHAYGFSNTLALFCIIMWVSHGLLLAALTIPSIMRLFEILPAKRA